LLGSRLAGRAAVFSALVVFCFNVGPAAAEDEAATLERAVKLFENGDYLAAQELIVGVDRAKLSPKQQSARDDYLNRIQVAITMSEKAVRDLEDAETAIAEHERDKADKLLAGVLANEYAPQGARRSATNLQQELKGSAPAPGAVAAQQPQSPAAKPAAPPPVQPAAAKNEPPAKPAPPRPAPAAASPDSEKAKTLTREGDDMLQGGRYAEAERLYQEALRAVPGYPEAIEGLKRAAQHQQNVAGTGAETLVERIQRDDLINWQRTVAEYREAEQAIRDHVKGERFDEAGQTLIRARQIVDAGKQFADPASKYESLKSEVDALGQWVANEERSYNERKVAEIQRDIERQRAERIRLDQENRTRQVEALMNQALQHRKDGDLDSAVNVLRQVTVIDPKYQPARWMMDDLEDRRQFQRGREVRKDFYDQSRGALNEVEEAKIPWYMELKYPKNWPELISRPERRGGRTRPDMLHGALDKPIPVDFKHEPFDQVMERLADAHRLNIIVNWNDLQRAGIERTVPIDLSLPNDITLHRALTEVLDQAGAGVTKVGFDVAEGTIKIATRQTLDKETYTAVYDITDLLQEIPIFNDAPLTDLTQVNKRTNAAAAPKEAKRPSSRESDDDDDEGGHDPERASRVRSIINLLQETVAPDSWRDRGGSVGNINEINGQLVITQNSSAQRQIADVLGKLREQRAVQIAVEARFVTVSSHYLEELGVDLDVVLNQGNAGFDYLPNGTGGTVTDPVLGSPLLLPRSFSRLGFTPATPAGIGIPNTTGGPVPQPFTRPFLVPQRGGGSGGQATPVPIINRVTSFTDPSNLGSDVPGSFAGQTLSPAMSVFGSFLDNIQVDFLLRATQADSRTSILTAPRLVLFNGQRSWVAVTIQQNFVSTLNPIVQQGAVGTAPVTSVIDSGAVLDVNATVTPDKRYVTMTLRPGVTRLLALQTIPFSGGAAGGGFGGGGTALAAFVQLPTLSSQRVQTTVSVPDGGTLLIGGQKLAAESEIEAGVPILSKIPILKRAYSSRSMIKDEQTLLMLIKPKILIQTEQEELAFPSFSPGQGP
jgi:type II secretory pathway component GspD/PulD (secretin)/tetratricopeptide (TPR) repeat protein